MNFRNILTCLGVGLVLVLTIFTIFGFPTKKKSESLVRVTSLTPQTQNAEARSAEHQQGEVLTFTGNSTEFCVERKRTLNTYDGISCDPWVKLLNGNAVVMNGEVVKGKSGTNWIPVLGKQGSIYIHDSHGGVRGWVKDIPELQPLEPPSPKVPSYQIGEQLVTRYNFVLRKTPAEDGESKRILVGPTSVTIQGPIVTVVLPDGSPQYWCFVRILTGQTGFLPCELDRLQNCQFSRYLWSILQVKW